MKCVFYFVNLIKNKIQQHAIYYEEKRQISLIQIKYQEKEEETQLVSNFSDILNSIMIPSDVLHWGNFNIKWDQNAADLL